MQNKAENASDAQNARRHNCSCSYVRSGILNNSDHKALSQNIAYNPNYNLQHLQLNNNIIQHNLAFIPTKNYLTINLFNRFMCYIDLQMQTYNSIYSAGQLSVLFAVHRCNRPFSAKISICYKYFEHKINNNTLLLQC